MPGGLRAAGSRHLRHAGVSVGRDARVLALELEAELAELAIVRRVQPLLLPLEERGGGTLVLAVTARLGQHHLERLRLEGLEHRHQVDQVVIAKRLAVVDRGPRLEHERLGLEPLVTRAPVAEEATRLCLGGGPRVAEELERVGQVAETLLLVRVGRAALGRRREDLFVERALHHRSSRVPRVRPGRSSDDRLLV